MLLKACLRETGMINQQNKLCCYPIRCHVYYVQGGTKNEYPEETVAVGFGPLNGLAHSGQVRQVFV